MKRYILDTNICLAYVRGHNLYQKVENDLNLSDPNVVVIISVATKGELLSLGVQRGWAQKKIQQLINLLRKLIIIDINEQDTALMNAYADIDAFSQGKLHHKPLNASARNMGKNDLWIAATAYISSAELVTTDNDFDHLNGVFIKVLKYQVK